LIGTDEDAPFLRDLVDVRLAEWHQKKITGRTRSISGGHKPRDGS
jgi:hypothetical protein